MNVLIEPNPRFSSHLTNIPLFSGLTEPQKERLLRAGAVAAFEPGELLFREGDPVGCFYILKTGRVKARRISPSGHEVVLHLAEPPQMVGCPALTAPGSRYPADGVALDPVVALRFCRERFLAAAGEFPEILLKLLANMNQRLKDLYSQKAASMEPVEQRIAIFLLRQALPRGAQLSEWNFHPLAEVRLTKSLLASMVGTSTETAIRILSRWKKRKLVASERGKIRIVEPGAIYALGLGMDPRPTWSQGPLPRTREPVPERERLVSRAV